MLQRRNHRGARTQKGIKDHVAGIRKRRYQPVECLERLLPYMIGFVLLTPRKISGLNLRLYSPFL
jgi:hypothetical protein